MTERAKPTPPMERVTFLKHPILAGRLLWTNKRISTFENTLKQAERIMGLSQVKKRKKKEANHNSEIANGRLFELQKNRDGLLRKVGKSKITQAPTIAPGDDVFRGYDL